MKSLKDGPSLQVAGYIILAAGLSGTALDYIFRYFYSFPQNMGIVLGNSAIVLLGCVTWMAATSIKKLERRLDLLEGKTSSHDRPLV
jgi:hypothetical protein